MKPFECKRGVGASCVNDAAPQTCSLLYVYIQYGHSRLILFVLFEHFVLKSAKLTPSLYELVLKNKFTYTQKRKLQALGIFTHDSVG